MVVKSRLEENEETDIVVVGSGIAGISSAYYLEKAGYEVTVLEEFEVASGATQYSSGILYFGSGTDFQTAIKLWDVDRAGELWCESKKAIDDAIKLIKKNNWNVGLRSPGALIVARSEEEAKYLEQEAAAMEQLGFAGELLNADGIAGHYAGCKFSTGLFQPMCSQLKPSVFVPLLAESLKAKVFQNSPMLKVEQENGKAIVQTSLGLISAEHVVIATNLKPVFGLEQHFFQEGSVLLPSQNLGNDLKELWPRETILWTPDEKYDLMYGHDGVAFLEMYNLQGVEEKIKRYFPPRLEFQRSKTIGDAWSKTSDWLPIVGSVEKNIHIAIAMGDQGIVMGLTSGQNIPFLINGETSNFLKMTSTNRFT